MNSFGVVVEGITRAADFRINEDRIRTAALQAVNKVARDTRARAAREISAQLNLPRSYVSPASGRLAVRQKASKARPEAIITAKGRPVSLARYVVGSPGAGAGVTVSVKPGQSARLRRAFLLRLPQGSNSVTDTRFNAGLAIRLAPGEKINNKIQQVKLAKGLYLLYGPSVQQVFLSNEGRGVADDLADPTAEALEDEFLRLLKL